MSNYWKIMKIFCVNGKRSNPFLLRQCPLFPLPYHCMVQEVWQRPLTRMDKITRALARCKWHEFKRRKSLLIAMMKTLNHIKRQTLTP